MQPCTSSGDHARQLIQQQLARLRDLHPLVLADRDPEPLHQFRVSLRRLRALLQQFGPALVLPRRISRARIAAVARATGRCRDGDVLSAVLETQLLPQLQAAERKACAPLRRRLRQQRRRAFVELRDELGSKRYRNLMEQLEAWCRTPRFSRLGQLDLTDWLQEWLLASTGCCFLHAGWFAADPAAPDLHDLRKRIKEVRYGLEALRDRLGSNGEAWIADLRRVQSCLGDLHDQEVLLQLLCEARGGSPTPAALIQALEAQRDCSWQQWQRLTEELLPAQRRRSLVGLGAANALRRP